MNKALKLGLISAALSTSLFAASSAEQLSAQEENLVRGVIPGTKIEKIEHSQIDGIYKAYLGNEQILYVQPFKRLIFIGELYTNTGVSLTQQDRAAFSKEHNAKKLAGLEPKALLKDTQKVAFNKGSKRYEFLIFTDPECPYCDRAEKHFADKDVTLHVAFYPLDFHPNAKSMALAMLSAKDFSKAYKEFVKSHELPKAAATKEAEDKLSKMMALASEQGVQGTPMIYVIDKKDNKVVELISGANIPKIDEYLKKDK